MSTLYTFINQKNRSSSEADSPVFAESSPTNNNSFAIKIHKSYDIRDDDIHEDYAISYNADVDDNIEFEMDEPTIYTSDCSKLTSEGRVRLPSTGSNQFIPVGISMEQDICEMDNIYLTEVDHVDNDASKLTFNTSSIFNVDNSIPFDNKSEFTSAPTVFPHASVNEFVTPSNVNVKHSICDTEKRSLNQFKQIPSTSDSLVKPSITSIKQLQQSFLQNINNKLNISHPGNNYYKYGVNVALPGLTQTPINPHTHYESDISGLLFDMNCVVNPKIDSTYAFFDDKHTIHSNSDINLPSSNIQMNQHRSPNTYSGQLTITDHQATSNTQNIRSKLLNAFLSCNTPLSSQTNSDAELSDNEVIDPITNIQDQNSTHPPYLIQEHVNNAISKRKMHYKKISYQEIERSLSKYYDKNNKYSNEVDILITFIRGQKHLYTQSGYITQIKLYALTITALAITSLITVITPFIQKYWWKIIFVISGNAITTVLITVLKYMRFESACNTFTLLANHYEHYEHSLQITSNKLIFIQDEFEQTKIILDKMQEIEFKMRETSELCPIIIPVEVQKTFPVIYQTNIFTLIKKMDTHRKTLIIELKNIKNEIRYILYKWNSEERSYTDVDAIDNPQIQREKMRLLFLMNQKEKIKKELIEYKDNYLQIDDLFMKEIKYAEMNKKCLYWISCNQRQIQYASYTNPVIKEHLQLILS